MAKLLCGRWPLGLACSTGLYGGTSVLNWLYVVKECLINTALPVIVKMPLAFGSAFPHPWSRIAGNPFVYEIISTYFAGWKTPSSI